MSWVAASCLGSGCARTDSRERVETHSCKQGTTPRRTAHPRGTALRQDASDRMHPAQVLILETRLRLVSPKQTRPQIFTFIIIFTERRQEEQQEPQGVLHDSHQDHGLGCPLAPLTGEAGEDRRREAESKHGWLWATPTASPSLRHPPWTPQPFRTPCPQGQTSLPTVGQQPQGTKEPMAGQEGRLSILWQDAQGPFSV